MCIGPRNCSRELLPTMGTPLREQFLRKQDRAGPGDGLLREWLDVWVVVATYPSGDVRDEWEAQALKTHSLMTQLLLMEISKGDDVVSLYFLLSVYTGVLGFWSMLCSLCTGWTSFLLPMWPLNCPELSSNTSFRRDALLFSYSWLRFLTPFPFSYLYVSYFPIVFQTLWAGIVLFHYELTIRHLASLQVD